MVGADKPKMAAKAHEAESWNTIVISKLDYRQARRRLSSILENTCSWLWGSVARMQHLLLVVRIFFSFLFMGFLLYYLYSITV